MRRIYFLGPNGSYSQIIAKQAYPNDEQIACNTFNDVVRNIQSEHSAIGILPIENSITSDIHENMDFLFNHPVKIIAEGNLHVVLNCIGLKGASLKEIKNVYSHYKALEQCNKFIKSHALKPNNAQSTAEAAHMILAMDEKENAMIGSMTVINNQKLDVLKKDIGDIKSNITRFVFVAHEKSSIEPDVQNKVSMVCTIAHRPGTLARLLNALAKLGVNLTKIESRPIPGTDWEYQFWIDIELDTTVHDLPTILKTITSETMHLSIKGAYEIGKTYES